MGATDSKQPAETATVPTVEQLLAIVAQKDERITTLERQVASLIEKLEQLSQLEFGAAAGEKRPPRSWIDALLGLQGVLPFKELLELRDKVVAAKQATVAESTTEAATASEPKPRKRNGPRKDFPEHLPRRVIRKELSEDERRAPCGRVMKEIGIEVTRELERISVTFVNEHHVVKYACDEHPEEGVRTAPGRQAVIEGGLLGPGFLADVICERMGNHMPYHRLEQKYAGEGLSLSRSVLCNSALRCAELLEPVFIAQTEQILGDVLVQLDDTSVVVRNGREAGREFGRIWAYRSQQGLICYHFTTDRCHERPLAVLGNFQGYVQGDASSVHDALFVEGSGRLEVGCWAHAFRKFEDAKDSEPTLAGEILGMLGKLYDVERKAKDAGLGPQARGELRVRESQPLLDQIRDWLELTLTKVLPAGWMAKAVGYVRNHWKALTRFVTDGRIEEIDNNLCEQALRRVAVGRKNWMFIGIEGRGQSNAILMSLVNTCKALRINPHEYLRDVLVRISIETDVQRLTPRGWKQDQEAAQRVEASRRAIAAVVRGLVFQAR